MPGTVSLADLATRVRRRASHENSLFVSDAEVEEYVEQSLGALYDLVLESNGPVFWQHVSQETATIAGTQDYLPEVSDQIPVEIYKVIAVELQWGGRWRKLRPYTAADELRLEDEHGWTDHSRVFYRALFPSQPNGPLGVSTGVYRHIRFTPVPRGVHTFRVRYIPVPGDWTGLGATYLFQGLSGWDEWVVCDAAAKILEKEESLEQAQFLLARREQAADRIRWASSTMNEDDQGRVRDLDEEALAWAPRRAFQ